MYPPPPWGIEALNPCLGCLGHDDQQALACSRLQDGGGKSFSNKKCEKRAFFPPPPPPFPSRARLIFALLVLAQAKQALDTLDCKTVRIFAYSSTREQSNKMSGMRLKTERETGERRFFPSRLTRFARKTLTPRCTDFFTDFEKKPNCFAVYRYVYDGHLN